MNEEKTISKIQLGLILTAILLFLVLDLSSAWAQKGEFTVFGGYRLGGGFEGGSLDLAEQDLVQGLKIQSSPDFGLIFGVWLVESTIMLEFILERQSTELTFFNSEIDRKSTFFDLNLDSYELGIVAFPGSSKKIQPFFALTWGLTRLVPKGDFNNEKGIAFGYVLGAKTLLSKRVGFRLQSRVASAWFGSVEAAFCNESDECYDSPKTTWMFQLDISGGLFFTF